MKKIRFIITFLTFVLCSTFFIFNTHANNIQEVNPIVSTELVFIVDKSGSMHHLTDDTIGSFNSMLAEQKKSEIAGDVYVTTVMFNHERTKIHNRKNLKDVSSITRNDYSPNGCTALLDAVGNTINELSNKKICCNCCKYCDNCNHKNKVVFVIITDGYENASKEFRKEQVKKLIEDKQTNDKWEFIFLGANIDSESAASGIGIEAKYSRNFCANSEGIKDVCKLASSAITQVRENKKIDLEKIEKSEQ